MKRLVSIGLILAAFSLSAQEKPDALQKYRAGKYQEAIQICLLELEAMPRNMDSYAVLCWSLAKLERFEECLTYGLKGLEISANDIRIIEVTGEAYYNLGKNLEALKLFEEYAVLAPTGDRIEDVYYYMGQIYIRMGEYIHADIALTTAVYYNPNVARWWSRLGYAREMAGDYRYALEAYDRALQLNPGYTEAQRGKERVQNRIGSL